MRSFASRFPAVSRYCKWFEFMYHIWTDCSHKVVLTITLCFNWSAGQFVLVIGGDFNIQLLKGLGVELLPPLGVIMFASRIASNDEKKNHTLNVFFVVPWASSSVLFLFSILPTSICANKRWFECGSVPLNNLWKIKLEKKNKCLPQRNPWKPAIDETTDLMKWWYWTAK